MAFIDQGVTGAYKQTWRKGNPRSLLRTIMSKNPKADEKRIHNLFWEEIEDDKELLRACVEYWLDHNYRSLATATERGEVGEKKPAATGPSPTTQQAAKVVAAQLKQRIEHELLNLMMPNDKRLGDCTGADCRKIGGWLGMLAKKVPANKTVKATLSEDQVFEVWQQATR